MTGITYPDASGSRYVTVYAAGPLWVMYDRARVWTHTTYLILHEGSRLTGSPVALWPFLRWLGLDV